MVDVRTQAEWTYVGVPDLSSLGKDTMLLELFRFPGNTPNTDFIPSLVAQLTPQAPRQVFFICRSGLRSMRAAEMLSAALGDESVACINVAEGFEGDLDADHHRGKTGGWKARGLPWRQS